MTQNDWVQRAQNGDLAAIAALLNRALHPQQITAKLRLTGETLQILLTAATPIDQPGAIALIRRGMEQVRPAKIRLVQIYGQPDGMPQPVWREQFSLEKPFWELDEAPPPEAPPLESPTPPAVSAQTAIAPVSPVRFQPAAQKSVTPVTAAAKLQPKPLTNRAIGALLTGLILALGVFKIGPLHRVFYGFLVLVHELGHALTHWLFGRPALPAINILYGGGITFALGQVSWLVAIIYGGLGWLAYKVRAYPGWLGVLAGFSLLYTVCLLTPINLILSKFMGHGMECVAIALCLYFATSGYCCRIKGDRAIYAMLGFFTLFNTVEFSWQLSHDADFRAVYEEGVGGVIDNDFVILANQYLGLDLATIATAFGLACLAAPVIAFLVFRYEAWWVTGLKHLSQRRAID